MGQFRRRRRRYQEVSRYDRRAYRAAAAATSEAAKAAGQKAGFENRGAQKEARSEEGSREKARAEKQAQLIIISDDHTSPIGEKMGGVSPFAPKSAGLEAISARAKVRNWARPHSFASTIELKRQVQRFRAG